MSQSQPQPRRPLAADIFAALGPVAAVHEATMRALVALATLDRQPAIHALLGEPLPGATAAARVGPIAVLPLVGVLTPRPSWISEALGWTDLESFRRDLEVALAAPEIAAILLDVNSPGGVIEGVNATALAVAAAGKLKPLAVWVEGVAASAAYWIIAGARDIAIDATGVLGSIGATVIATLQVAPDSSGQQEFSITSTGAPRKHPDPRTEAGAAELRRNADALAGEMIATIRSLRPKLTDMRDGAIEIGQAAVAAKLADRVLAGIEAAAQALAPRQGPGAPRVARAAGKLLWQQPTERTLAMDYATLSTDLLRQHRPDLVTALTEPAVKVARDAAAQANVAAVAVARTEGLAEGAKGERTRILGIEAQALPGHEKIIQAAKEDGKTTPEQVALTVLGAERTLRGAALAGLAAAAPVPAAPAEPKSLAAKPVTEDEHAAADKRGYADKAELRAEFKTEADYLAWRRAERKGLTPKYPAQAA